MALTAGTRLGVYEVTAQIGEGGMGQVYRATDTKLKRQVAIKILPPSFAADYDRLARFQREAEVLASLNHPNIAAIFGLEDGDGIKALVMELVEGEDLSQRTARGAIPLDDALLIAKQIAEALEAAHEQGIIHRDLKPANIKVREDGTVKILDFGLAKAMDPAGASSGGDAMNSPTLTARATQMGTIIGTAAYMSPEQAKGRSVDRRADIWAFGVVFFEMLTGRRGYEGEDVSDTLAAVLTREVDWAQLPANIPPRIRVLLFDCLVRDPKQRLRDIGEARRVIDRVIKGEPDSIPATASPAVPVRPPASALMRALPWAIAVLAVLAAGSAIWKLLSAPPPPARSVTRSKALLKEQAGFVDLSRDGTKLVYTTTGGPKGFLLVVRQMDQFEARPLPGADGGLYPIFSPAADWIAFTLGGKIKKIPIAGGTSITLCDGTLVNGAAWGDDDTIVFSGANGLMRVPAGGGTPQTLTSLDKTKGENRHVGPQFLPGGRQLLFSVLSSSSEDPQFAVLDLQEGTYRAIGKGGLNGRYVPSGHLTFVRGGSLFATPFDLARLTVAGPEVPVIEGVSMIGPPGTGDYAVAESGVLEYVESLTKGGTTLTWLDRKGAATPLPGQVPRLWGTGRLSPDGRRVANAIAGDKESDIWVVDLARGTPTRLTFNDQSADHPIWTPDGVRIVYGGTKDGKAGIFAVPADGSGQPELVIGTETNPVPTSFTPDGGTLLYTQVVGGKSRVLVLPPAAPGAARQPHPLREGAGADNEAQVSPDGKWVSLSSNESGQFETYVLPFPGPGPKTQVSTLGGRRARWARSGRELFYWSGTGAGNTLASVLIQTAPFSAGPPREVFTTFSGTTWDVAPDSEHFLIEGLGSFAAGSVFVTVTDWFDELRRSAPAKK